MEPFDRLLTSTAMVAAMLVAVAAGLVLAVDVFHPLPEALALGAGVTWLCGLIAIGTLAYNEARRSGTSFRRSIGKGVRLFGRSLFAFLPP